MVLHILEWDVFVSRRHNGLIWASWGIAWGETPKRCLPTLGDSPQGKVEPTFGLQFLLITSFPWYFIVKYKNEDQKRETTKINSQCLWQTSNVQKGTETYTTELPKFANEPQMYNRYSGERKNYAKKVFLELCNELAATFKYPIMKQLRVTVSACGVKT